MNRRSLLTTGENRAGGYMAERDESGRFEAGTSGNPVGRPRGAANRLNREIREMLRQALS